MRKKNILYFILFLVIGAPILLAADEGEEAKVVRDEKGIVISDIQHRNLPSDRKVMQVANNVIRAESADAYTARRIDQLEAALQQISSHVAEAQKEIEILKAQVDKIEAKEAKEEKVNVS